MPTCGSAWGAVLGADVKNVSACKLTRPQSSDSTKRRSVGEGGASRHDSAGNYKCLSAKARWQRAMVLGVVSSVAAEGICDCGGRVCRRYGLRSQARRARG